MKPRGLSAMMLMGAAGLLLAGCSTSKKTSNWGDWQAECRPEEVGRRVAVNLLERPLAPPRYPMTRPASTGTTSRPAMNSEVQLNNPTGATTRPAGGRGLPYAYVCTAYGALRFAGEIQDQQLIRRLKAHHEPLLNESGRRLVPAADHVDRSVFGILPMEIYRQTGDKRFLALGKKSADAQWVDPIDGLTGQTRFWIDDMFMITALQTQAYRATKDPAYLDRAAHEMVVYLDKLQQPTGLFFHGMESPYYWGRGNGWVAVGLTEILMELPENHPDRPRIFQGYQKMMAALLKYQAPSGMWRQLVDNPQAWDEASCTGMFTFAMATGVRRGWLEAVQYKEPVRRAWTALCRYVDAYGNVSQTCVGTNQSHDLDFYMNRPRAIGDYHGQAAVIWAAWALLQ